MNFPLPRTDVFTIYSKSGCSDCNKVKLLLQNNNIQYHVINCDDFVLDHHDEFIRFMISLTGIKKTRISFPCVFNHHYIGGHDATMTYVEQMKKDLLEFDASF